MPQKKPAPAPSEETFAQAIENIDSLVESKYGLKYYKNINFLSTNVESLTVQQLDRCVNKVMIILENTETIASLTKEDKRLRDEVRTLLIRIDDLRNKWVHTAAQHHQLFFKVKLWRLNENVLGHRPVCANASGSLCPQKYQRGGAFLKNNITNRKKYPGYLEVNSTFKDKLAGLRSLVSFIESKPTVLLDISTEKKRQLIRFFFDFTTVRFTSDAVGSFQPAFKILFKKLMLNIKDLVQSVSTEGREPLVFLKKMARIYRELNITLTKRKHDYQLLHYYFEINTKLKLSETGDLLHDERDDGDLLDVIQQALAPPQTGQQAASSADEAIPASQAAAASSSAHANAGAATPPPMPADVDSSRISLPPLLGASNGAQAASSSAVSPADGLIPASQAAAPFTGLSPIAVPPVNASQVVPLVTPPPALGDRGYDWLSPLPGGSNGAEAASSSAASSADGWIPASQAAAPFPGLSPLASSDAGGVAPLFTFSPTLRDQQYSPINAWLASPQSPHIGGWEAAASSSSAHANTASPRLKDYGWLSPLPGGSNGGGGAAAAAPFTGLSPLASSDAGGVAPLFTLSPTLGDQQHSPINAWLASAQPPHIGGWEAAAASSALPSKKRPRTASGKAEVDLTSEQSAAASSALPSKKRARQSPAADVHWITNETFATEQQSNPKGKWVIGEDVSNEVLAQLITHLSDNNKTCLYYSVRCSTSFLKTLLSLGLTILMHPVKAGIDAKYLGGSAEQYRKRRQRDEPLESNEVPTTILNFSSLSAVQSRPSEDIETRVSHPGDHFHAGWVKKAQVELTAESRVCFIYAHRDFDSAMVPEVSPRDNVHIILVITEEQYEEHKKQYQGYCHQQLSLLKVQSMQHPGSQQAMDCQRLTARRLASFLFAAEQGLTHCMAFDDNIRQVYFNSEAGSSEGPLGQVFSQMLGYQREHSEPIVGINTRSQYKKYDPYALCCKVFMFDMAMIGGLLQTDARDPATRLRLFALFPEHEKTWGEDFYIQFMMHCLLAEEPQQGYRPIEGIVLDRSRGQGHACVSAGVQAKVISFSDYHEAWLRAQGLAEISEKVQFLYNTNLKMSLKAREGQLRYAATINPLEAIANIQGVKNYQALPELDAPGDFIPAFAAKLDEVIKLLEAQNERAQTSSEPMWAMRPYQMEALKFVLAQCQTGATTPDQPLELLFDIVTGGGKSLLQGLLALTAASVSNQPVVISTPYQTLSTQMTSTIKDIIDNFPSVASALKMRKEHVVSVYSGDANSTLSAREFMLMNKNQGVQRGVFVFCNDSYKICKQSLQNLALLLLDESHLRPLLEKISSATCFFSGTPSRNEIPRFAYTAEQAVKDGTICPLAKYALGLAPEKTVTDSYTAVAYLLKNFNVPLPNGTLGSSPLKNYQGVIYVRSQAEAEHLGNILENECPDLPIYRIYSQNADRRKQLDIFRAQSEPGVVIAVQMMREGVDVKKLRYVIDLSLGNNDATMRQKQGRVIRKNGSDKVGVVITLVKNKLTSEVRKTVTNSLDFPQTKEDRRRALDCVQAAFPTTFIYPSWLKPATKSNAAPVHTGLFRPADVLRPGAASTAASSSSAAAPATALIEPRFIKGRPVLHLRFVTSFNSLYQTSSVRRLQEFSQPIADFKMEQPIYITVHPKNSVVNCFAIAAVIYKNEPPASLQALREEYAQMIATTEVGAGLLDEAAIISLAATLQVNVRLLKLRPPQGEPAIKDFQAQSVADQPLVTLVYTGKQYDIIVPEGQFEKAMKRAHPGNKAIFYGEGESSSRSRFFSSSAAASSGSRNKRSALKEIGLPAKRPNIEGQKRKPDDDKSDGDTSGMRKKPS